jgi:hypothetical protein
MHQCPKCELRFTWNTELDDHCRTEHPEFHHDYPATAAPAVEEEVTRAVPVPESRRRWAILSTWWNER